MWWCEIAGKTCSATNTHWNTPNVCSSNMLSRFWLPQKNIPKTKPKNILLYECVSVRWSPLKHIAYVNTTFSDQQPKILQRPQKNSEYKKIRLFSVFSIVFLVVILIFWWLFGTFASNNIHSPHILANTKKTFVTQ